MLLTIIIFAAFIYHGLTITNTHSYTPFTVHSTHNDIQVQRFGSIYLSPNYL